MSAHNGPLSRIFIFLLAPTEKLFECVRLEVFADIGINATVGDILDLIPRKATEPALVAQSLVGLCRRTDDHDSRRRLPRRYAGGILTNRNQRAAECINNGELLIAIPAGFTAVRCQSLVDRILKQQPKIRKLLQRTDPLAPRKSKPSKGSSGSGGGSNARSKASSRSSRTTGGLTGLGLEAIEEGENESKSTMSRDDGNDESFGASNVSDDNITATDSKSNLNDLRKGEEEIRVAIENTREHNGSGVEEQQVDLDNEDCPAINYVERLAREASELESPFMTMPESSISYESPDSPPKKRRMHKSVAHHRKDENATLTSACLSKSQQPADDSGVLPTRRDHFKATKQRIKRAIKRKLKASTCTVASAAFVAFASALYHMGSPNPLGLSSYVAFIVVFLASVAVLRRRKLSSSIARRRRRSRSLSTTPIRKGSIRRIQIAKNHRGTSTDP